MKKITSVLMRIYLEICVMAVLIRIYTESKHKIFDAVLCIIAAYITTVWLIRVKEPTE